MEKWKNQGSLFLQEMDQLWNGFEVDKVDPNMALEDVMSEYPSSKLIEIAKKNIKYIPLERKNISKNPSCDLCYKQDQIENQMSQYILHVCDQCYWNTTSTSLDTLP
jgi:hypothetical protein